MADWHSRAKYYEACNCALGCPCNFNGYPTDGKCEGNLAFWVTEASGTVSTSLAEGRCIPADAG